MSLVATNNIAACHSGPQVPDHGHRFDSSRHWDAFLTLGFKGYSEDKPSTQTPDNTHSQANSDTKSEANQIESSSSRTITRMNIMRHYGPLRVQRPFYPEGRDGCCHVYLLHPPGGIASGDSLNIDVTVTDNATTLLTTPAANKLYRADSNNVAWSQYTHLKVSNNSILEWLPQETLAFDGSLGKQTILIDLDDSSKCLGWEIMGLGRPASNLPFASGKLEQHFSLTQNGKPLWIEKQVIDPTHDRFMGKWGQGGASVHATLWVVGLEDPEVVIKELRETLLDNTKAAYKSFQGTPTQWAVTYRRGVLLLRYLGMERNDVWALFQQARNIIRPHLTGLEATTPRIWLT